MKALLPRRLALLIVAGAVLLVPLPGAAGIIVGPLPCPPGPSPRQVCDVADGQVQGAEDAINLAGSRSIDLVNRSGSPVRVAPGEGWDGITAVVPGISFPGDGDPAGFRIGPLPCPPAPSPKSVCKPVAVAGEGARDGIEALNATGARSGGDWWLFVTRQTPGVDPSGCSPACAPATDTLLRGEDKAGFRIGPLPCPPSPRSVCSIAGLLVATAETLIDTLGNDVDAGTWAWVVTYTPSAGQVASDPGTLGAYVPCHSCGVDYADGVAPKAPGCTVEIAGSCAPGSAGPCGARCAYDAALSALGGCDRACTGPIPTIPPISCEVGCVSPGGSVVTSACRLTPATSAICG